MALTELALAGGAFLAGVKTYQMRTRKKRLAPFLQPGKADQEQFQRSLTGALDEAKTAVQDFAQDTLVPLFRRERRAQFIDVSSSVDERDIQEAEQALNRRLAVFGVSFGLASAGALAPMPLLSFLSVPTVLYVLKGVYTDSFQAMVKENKINVDTLSALLVTAYIIKGYFIFCHLHAFLYILNRKLLTKVKRDSRSHIVDVFRQQPREVWVLVNGVEVEMPLEAVEPGDIVVAHTGESVAIDGVITEGAASIDQHILTGESQPLEKGVGDSVFAMTVVLAGRVCIKVEKTGEETTIAHIGHMLNRTSYVKTDTQLWAETITNRTALPMLAISAGIMPFMGPAAAMVLLNAHFRYRLIIAASTCVLTYVNLASQKGILIKDGRTFELLNQIDAVVFDKTGTLTEEQPHIDRIHAFEPANEHEILRYAAAAEANQTHPIAQAILQAAAAHDISVPMIDEAAYTIGYGITVTLDQQVVRVGSFRFMEMETIEIPIELEAVESECYTQGHSLVLVAVGHRVVGAIELHATVRPEAKSIIAGLRQRGIESLYIISGDHEAPTRTLATEVGIDGYFAQTLPEDKADLIEKLQRDGKTVCYVGDGINDAIALKRAEVSVSLRGASTIATDTAQVILMDGSLGQLCNLFDMAREYDARMKTTFKTILGFGVVSLGGVVYPTYGLPFAVIMSWISMLTGFSSAMWPLIQHRKEVEKAASRELPSGLGDVEPAAEMTLSHTDERTDAPPSSV